MVSAAPIAHDLSAISGLEVDCNVPLSQHTRFGIGGPAAVLARTASEADFAKAMRLIQASGWPCAVIGSGTNLIVSDAGFPGVVLRFTNSEIRVDGNRLYAAAGASLQDAVDFAGVHGLAGIETMTGIPGSVGAAVYGNAGAYGRSISQTASEVRFFDGREIRSFDNAQCQFRYRESIFKKNKKWIVFSMGLELESGDSGELQRQSSEILKIRNRKYPPSMKCAGSIFKNLILSELPASVRNQVPEGIIIEGKVPSAWFLEQVGAKGMVEGGIRVAEYHANLIYNEGSGTATELRKVIFELKRRIAERFGFDIEEEVQYVGF